MPNKKTNVTYENNPFFIAVNGLSLLFNAARGVAILFFIFSLVSFYGGGWQNDNPNADSVRDKIDSVTQGWTGTEWSLALISILIIGLAIAMISALFSGVASYTSVQVAKGNQVAISEAFRVSFENLWSYLWLQILTVLKILLWSLLFIIPGIYMAYRYSLSGLAFYDDSKHLRGNNAIKESLRLTKGAWMTTFAANTLFNLITLTVASYLVTPSVNAILYRQFDSSDEKPKPHWLSGIVIGIIATVAIITLFVIVVESYQKIN
ncbi:MAG: hypothetical protein WAW80_01420 [Candidatus Saccharimonadales bacterium]